MPCRVALRKEQVGKRVKKESNSNTVALPGIACEFDLPEEIVDFHPQAFLGPRTLKAFQEPNSLLLPKREERDDEARVLEAH